MRIGSLFSGIGGLELGLEWAGVGETIWQVEQDAFCQTILAKHWPHAARHGDVRAVGAGSLAPVDLICGGFPCQDISLAGAGAGIDGERSGLWKEFDRIVGELAPRFVVVENVGALVSRGLDRVLGNLATRGYDALWMPVRAADVGAPHRRERIFIVGWRRCGDGVADADRERQLQSQGGECNERGWTGHGGAQLADGLRPRRQQRAGACGVKHGGAEPADGGAMDDAEEQPVQHLRGDGRDEPHSGEGRWGGVIGEGRDGLAHRDPPGLPDGRQRGCTRHAGPCADGDCQPEGPTESRMGGVVDGLPARMDRWPSRPGEDQHEWEAPRTATGIPQRAPRLKALGNAVVPQVAYVVGRVVMEIARRQDA